MTTYRNPALTVDLVIEHGAGIVLIERRNPPHGHALPGGFVDYGETVEAAAVREAAEETSLRVTLKGLLGVYSDPSRDARQHTVSVVFVAEGHGTLQAADDAKDARVVTLDTLPTPLCFDHARILDDYRAWLGRQDAGSPRMSAEDQRVAADLAWHALAAAIAAPISSIRTSLRSGPLAEPGACVVSVRDRSSGNVRGTAGSAEVRPVLAIAIEEATQAAVAIAQPPIRRGELSQMQVEIRVLALSDLVIVATND